MVKRGLLVGRFQPFHCGHLAGVKKALEDVNELVIVIGSAQYSHDLDNPFTAGERLVMILSALKEAKIDCSRVWVVPVPDVHLHMMWVAEVEGYTPHFDVVYTNEPLTKRLFAEAGYKIKPIPFYKRNVCSSTEIRKKIINDEDWEENIPESVASFIKKVDGVARLKDLVKSDKVQPCRHSSP
jgi:nicotinamide-nucleotide adenylyltransferase